MKNLLTDFAQHCIDYLQPHLEYTPNELVDLFLNPGGLIEGEVYFFVNSNGEYAAEYQEGRLIAEVRKGVESIH